jgi:methionine-R-sulfoxide reductase
MNGTRVTSDETSRVSLGIGLVVAVALIGVVIFFIVQAVKKVPSGFDPDRPVPSDSELHRRLSADQYRITRENGTETAFRNEYWDNTRAGIYVDVITGEPLFSSLDKFDAGTGRPCFMKPISKDLLVEKKDTSHDMDRIEVRARRSDSHLGHVFDDPKSPTGRRYAVNSVAFRFIPLERMEHANYGKYVSLFPASKAGQSP